MSKRKAMIALMTLNCIATALLRAFECQNKINKIKAQLNDLPLILVENLCIMASTVDQLMVGILISFG